MGRPLREEYKADVIVVDPPRKGCDEKLLDVIVRMYPERVLYVSGYRSGVREMNILAKG